MNDFSKATLKALAKRGITIYGITLVPDFGNPMPYANGERCYKVNDNDCGRIWTFNEVLNAAKGA